MVGMTFSIREARQGDIAAIFGIRTSVRENHLSREALADLGITEATVAEMIESGPCAWVAVETGMAGATDGRACAGEVSGFSMIDAAEGTLFALFVLPSHEGRGLGRTLLRQAEEQLFTRHDRITLETGATTRAAEFYRRNGWGAEQDLGRGDIRLEKRRGA